MPIADTTSGAYEITLVLHILTVMAGLGVTFWYAAYGLRGMKAAQSGDGMGAAALAEANHAVSGVAQWIIFSIPVLGVGLVFMSDEVWDFGQTWVWLSLVLFGLALTNALTILQPSGRKIAELSRELANAGAPPAGASEPPPQVLEIDALGKRLGMLGGINHLLVVVILYLMVAKPGG